MLKVNHGDTIILKALNVPGLVCQKGRVSYFQNMEDIYYRCTLNYTDDVVKEGFLIQEHHILKVIDHMTNTVIYIDDLTDGL